MKLTIGNNKTSEVIADLGAIMDERSNEIEVYVSLKRMEKIAKDCLTWYQDRFVKAYDMGGDTAVMYDGVKIERAEVGVKYDFENCNDEIMKKLIEEKKELDDRIKEREKFLKSLPVDGFEFANPNTGEIITIYPPARSSKTSLKATIR